MATDMPLGFPADLELERRLDAFATARLAPSREATSQTRAAVLAAIAAQVQTDLGAPVSRRPRTVAVTSRSTAFGRHRPVAAARWSSRWVRPMSAVAAACLMVSMLAGSALAARPGGPLYPARLLTEYLTLPAAGQARVDAEITRLERRLDEARRAVAAGDADATLASIEAYASIVRESTNEASGDDAALGVLRTDLANSDAALVSIVAAAPAAARDRLLTLLPKVVPPVAPGRSRPDAPATAPGSLSHGPSTDHPDAPASRPGKDNGKHLGQQPATAPDAPGNGAANRNGAANGNANGHGSATSSEWGCANGNGKANGNANGHAAKANGSANGNGKASGNGQGNGNGKGGASDAGG